VLPAATEGADEVPAERLVDALLTLEHASLEEHLRITCELLDTRGDGSIARENMVEILKVGVSRAACKLPPLLPCQLRSTAGRLCGRGGGRNLDVGRSPDAKLARRIVGVLHAAQLPAGVWALPKMLLLAVRRTGSLVAGSLSCAAEALGGKTPPECRSCHASTHMQKSVLHRLAGGVRQAQDPGDGAAADAGGGGADA
jgi:hypothetical protein